MSAERIAVLEKAALVSKEVCAAFGSEADERFSGRRRGSAAVNGCRVGRFVRVRLPRAENLMFHKTTAVLQKAD